LDIDLQQACIVHKILKVKRAQLLKNYKGEYFMDNEIIVALVAMAGTIIGSFGGIVTSSKLTSFRLEKLEQKVDKHNSFAERIPVVEEKIRTLDHRIEDIEKGGIIFDEC